MNPSCTIIISHYESLAFLRTCIRQIRKFSNPNVRQHIIISDQSGIATQSVIDLEFGSDSDITIVHTLPLYSGYGIDYIMRNTSISTEYICQIHVDAFPISKSWLFMPIKLIEENNFSFVGQLQFISNPNDGIYPPSRFFAMAQAFNIAKTETYKELSFEAGFTRFHNRPQAEMEWKNTDWDLWASENYAARGSDDDVVAFCWEDNHREHDKLGLAITGFIEPSYGRIIEDVVFHFGSCREAIGVSDKMPKLYQEYTKKINENYSDALIEEMVGLAKANHPSESQILSRNHWNGKKKTATPPSESLNKRIEELKK